jgi:tetratricopeptide (TPR) repeat protein
MAMAFGWLDARHATEAGSALADEYAPAAAGKPGSSGHTAPTRDPGKALQGLLSRAERELHALRLNVYQKARFANAFKWRLIENGVGQQLADEVTARLLLQLSGRPGTGRGPAAAKPALAPVEPAGTGTVRTLVGQGDQHMARGAYDEAVRSYESMLALNPRNAGALNSLGAALVKLGRYKEAEPNFRRSLRIRPNSADALGNLGALLRWRGLLRASEQALRRALRLKAGDAELRSSLGLTLLAMGHTSEASGQFEKALKLSPRHPAALLGMGQIAKAEGRFDQAAVLFQRVLDTDPKVPSALAQLASLRRMSAADATWLQRAEALAGNGLAPLEESDLRFAMGKYHDDIGDYDRAFQNYRRANELQKTVAEDYDRAARTHLVDELIRTYTRTALSKPQPGASASARPVFIVGMMRSGTSLAEQILASHPAVHGAGELAYWSDMARAHEATVRRSLPDEALRAKLAADCLATLDARSRNARHVVDKAPVNFEHLGLILTVFPNARIIHARRDPLDTCLSCYFQQFSAALNFKLELADLAHYYREYQRLMAHWHAVLPAGSMLELPYSQLVADQERWTRRMLEFLGLDWDRHCVDFHHTQRTVSTASAWQVRQKIYTHAVERWRHYAKYLGPLRGLQDLEC